MPEKLYISAKGEFTDVDGNAVILRGVNLDPSVKLPATPFQTSHHGAINDDFFDGADSVSFINHPLPLEEVEIHINRLKSLGFNSIRLPFTWESIAHEGPDIYDFKYMDYVIEVLKKINSVGGMYVYLDPHQDVWSRFTGGSGAPIWTLLCAGFQPKRFKNTEAAILHNHYINPETGNEIEDEPYPKMLWPTNYHRLACQTMFTLFFGGKTFAPKCMINNLNIQDYLQGKFIDAIMAFYSRIQEKAPELFTDNCVIGLESINEPSNGYIGEKDLNEIDKKRKLRLGTTPTPFQSFLLGEGIKVTVDQYELSIFGPAKSKSKKVKPEGENAWLTQEERDEVDSKYGWVRHPDWKASECIWRLHNVWERGDNGNRLLKPEYFAKSESGKSIDDKYFINNYFVDYYKKLYTKFRKIDSKGFIFLQPPVFKEPPNLRDTNFLDENTICACHFYDGMSLMFKTWNKKFNVDTYGIIKDKYRNPAFSIVFGENSIRKSIRDQLNQMKNDAKSILGQNIPVFFTEIGMPFDMDNKKAYTKGDYSSQTKAMDALAYALEGNNISFSLWCYCYRNSHQWGDAWNNEDFSIWSAEDKERQASESARSTPRPTSSGSSTKSEFIKTGSTKNLLTPPSTKFEMIDLEGFRALDALLRPFPIKIHGTFVFAEFNLEAKTYLLEIHGKADSSVSTNKSTFIFLPQHHFPLSDVTIKASSGTFTYDSEYQILKWHHDPGKQYITVELNEDKKSRESSSSDCVIS